MSPVATPKSILKHSCLPKKTAAICRNVSFCSEESVRMADSYDRSPASPTTELSWSDIEELRRLQLEADGEDPLDEAKALMDLPALLAAAPTALLPLLPPITSISRPVPTLTLPAPRNRGGAGSLAPQKRPAAPQLGPPLRKRPLLAFLPLLPVGDATPSPGPVPMRNDPNAVPYFSHRPKQSHRHDADSPMTDESASPVTPPDMRRMHPLVPESDAGAQAFEITFKRRMESDW
ncbi:hypothetical protein CALVIDRAFT_532424 [Calocera viscosa TUFC12733]|uniref:Uncharacterized protein n=1 Tax=Calocera viscosa (strain TUFC12733) TaxID=1330018 RepID=A0A167S7Q7_CALVF|nr:hypothetical protein CALVIDRAFT_532424 [Calocera viscosa TUFC12733]